MSITKTDLLRAKLQAIQTALERARSSEKKNSYVSIAVAQNFNGIIEGVAEQFPAIASDLPQPLSTSGLFAEMGTSEVTFLDLEALTEQVLSLLSLVDDE